MKSQDVVYERPEAVVERADRALPRFVTREVEGYLRCGDPREGFAWLACGDCGSRWRAWSSLLWRVFGVVGFGCPNCGHAMQLRTVVLPPATLRVLASLPRSARGPP